MKRFVVAALGGALVLGSVAVPATAEACLHGSRIRRQVNPTLRDVRRAERLLASTRYDRAAKLAHQAFDVVDQLPPEPETALDTLALGDSPGQGLFVRAQRVAALAAVRSGGEVGPTRAWKGDTEEQRAQNLMWAVFVLQFQAAMQPDNTVLQAEYAEAAAAVPHMEPAAYAVLDKLAQDDLMPMASGYALLAKLQRARGDDTGSEVSLARCSDLTGQRCEVV